MSQRATSRRHPALHHHTSAHNTLRPTRHNPVQPTAPCAVILLACLMPQTRPQLHDQPHRHKQVQHCITQELQPLVVGATKARHVCQRLLQQRRVAEFIAQCLLLQGLKGRGCVWLAVTAAAGSREGLGAGLACQRSRTCAAATAAGCKECEDGGKFRVGECSQCST